MSNSITVGDITIHQSGNGLYSLNDLHKASGGMSRNKPEKWLKLESTKRYIKHLESKTGLSLESDGYKVVKGSAEFGGGTYVCKKLVYSYAMWVSVEFNDLVIDTFDAVANATTQQALIDTKHRLDNALQGDIFNKHQSPRDLACLQVIMKCTPFQARQYHDELVGKGILGYKDVPQPPRRVYFARQDHPAVIGRNGETVLFSESVKDLFPTQLDWVGGLA